LDDVKQMNLYELKKIASLGEGQHIEFKKNANHPKQIVKEIVGFANATGGSLFVGINDDGTLSGLKFAEDDAIFLSTVIEENIIPELVIKYEIIPLSKASSILHFRIEEGIEKPYGLRGSNDTKKVLYRVNDQCIQASRELKNILRGFKNDMGQVIKYTELENAILKIVDNEKQVTKKQLCNRINFSSRKISDCLVRLVVVGILKIIPAIDGDLYEYHP